MRKNYSFGVRSISLIGALFMLTFIGVNSCQKNKSPETTVKEEVAKPVQPDRLMSVANVYYTADGKKAEVWFYETPLVYEFDASDPNAKNNFETLKNAKENKLPVNLRSIANIENRIDVITPASSEQVASFKAEVSKREMDTEELPAPDSDASLPGTLPQSKGAATALISVVPNTTVLNNIFNTVRSQCCKLPGIFLYGQCIPFQFVADGCYARAHKTRQIIESYYGYKSYKVFNYACNGAGTLSVKATLWNNNCCVKWWYHVASYVIVQVGAAQYGYLIDPSMFSGPVSIPTWVAAQKNVSCGYNGSAQGQVYYTSNAYAPTSLNSTTCVLVPYADNTYTAANATCAAYAPKQGCSF
jgi:hypothetical protein